MRVVGHLKVSTRKGVPEELGTRKFHDQKLAFAAAPSIHARGGDGGSKPAGGINSMIGSKSL